MNERIAAMEALLELLSEMVTQLAGRTVSTTQVSDWLCENNIRGWNDWVRVNVARTDEIMQERTE